MARKKRQYNYKFIDEEKTFDRTVLIKCTQTGEEVQMYHKHLARLIEKKYGNRWNLFRRTYIKKGNRIKREDNPTEYDIRPEGYRRYLIDTYINFRDKSELDNSTRAGKLMFLNDCYEKRWNETIEEALKRAK